MPLNNFRNSLAVANPTAFFRDGLIGEGLEIPGANGAVPLVYADYVASGRALRQVEDFVADHVLPFYANTHTEDSFCGAYSTGLREEARAEIAALTNVGPECSVIFSGSGATSGLNRLVNLLGINQAKNPVVLHGPYEHHSNILPWRESKARVIEISESPSGGPDLAALEHALKENAASDLIIGSFSAASNVTGIITDTDAVTKVLKTYSALSVWDYAGAGPYLPIDMGQDPGSMKDAVVVSAHKFPGGPGASGVLIIRNKAVLSEIPTQPGGGTVSYVSPWDQDYLDDLVSKEESGTPNIIGDIRAALVFMIKDAIGQSVIEAREAKLFKMAMDGLHGNPALTILGAEVPHRLPIFSFLVHDAAGKIVPHKEFTKALSDLYGVQSRGGCACAGPYGHRLLNVSKQKSESLRAEVLRGNEDAKPGWVRLNFSYLMTDKTAQYIIESVNALARKYSLGEQYIPPEPHRRGVLRDTKQPAKFWKALAQWPADFVRQKQNIPSQRPKT